MGKRIVPAGDLGRGKVLYRADSEQWKEGGKATATSMQDLHRKRENGKPVQTVVFHLVR